MTMCQTDKFLCMTHFFPQVPPACTMTVLNHFARSKTHYFGFQMKSLKPVMRGHNVSRISEAGTDWHLITAKVDNQWFHPIRAFSPLQSFTSSSFSTLSASSSLSSRALTVLLSSACSLHWSNGGWGGEGEALALPTCFADSSSLSSSWLSSTAQFHQSYYQQAGICHNDEGWEYDKVTFAPFINP